MSEGVLENLPKNVMRRSVVQGIEDDIRSCTEQLENRNPSEAVSDPKAVYHRRRQLQERLDVEKPPDLSGSELDVLRKRNKEIEVAVAPLAPSRDEMMKNPPGTVGKNIAFERKHKQDILEWKRNQVILNQESEDPDAANFERIRRVSDRSVNYEDSQIGGEKAISVPTQTFMANYDEIDWTSGPAAEALQAEVKRAMAQMGTSQTIQYILPDGSEAPAIPEPPKPKKPRRKMTPEQRLQASDRLKKARAVKAKNDEARQREREAEVHRPSSPDTQQELAE
jgi:hypothetical protein